MTCHNWVTDGYLNGGQQPSSYKSTHKHWLELLHHACFPELLEAALVVLAIQFKGFAMHPAKVFVQRLEADKASLPAFRLNAARPSALAPLRC